MAAGRADIMGLIAAGVLAACDTVGAQLTIEDARATRDAAKNVVVDIDLVAREGLGGNVGTYCTRVTFTGLPSPQEVCSTDLRDGDTKTVRVVSNGGFVNEGAAIAIRVRLAAHDVEWNLVAPPAP
jgi:hypothetical protein